MKDFFKKILALLHVRSLVAGLEVSDAVLRLVYSKRGVWQMYAIRLAPGVMKDGIIEDRDTFIAAVMELKLKSGIVGKDAKKKVGVVVAISSVVPYSKVFRLPELEGNALEKAVSLNVEMASPQNLSEIYSSWQVVGRDEASGQIEILSAFMERKPVDGIVDALFVCGFVPMAVESKALAFTRLFREKGSGIALGKAYVLVSVDNEGIDFLIIRKGALYFEYSHRWAEMENQKGEVAFSAFKDELKLSLRQVLSFYEKQWTEPIAGVVIAAVAFHSEIEAIIAENMALPAIRLTLVMGQPISSEWLATLGSTLRDGAPREMIHEISFLGDELADRFRGEQILNFLQFWRIIIPVAGFALAAIFLEGYFLLLSAQKNIESAPEYALAPSQSDDMAALVASSTAFNTEVANIGTIENIGFSQGDLLATVQGIVATQGISISKMVFVDENIPISLSGLAPSETAIIAFKTAMMANPHIVAVNLPLTGIEPGIGNYSFSMTFEYQN